MSVLLGKTDLANYPYLKEAQQFLADSGLKLQNFEVDTDLKPVIEKAFQRVKDSIDGHIYKGKDTADMEILSFHIACMMVKSINNTRIINKFALAEARRAEKILESEIRMKTNDEMIIKIIKELFGMNIRRGGLLEYLIPVQDYIPRAVSFHEAEWKLVNRVVSEGNVYLTRHETVRLIRKELANLIATKIKAGQVKLPESFRCYLDQILEMAKQFNIVPKVSMEYPPCIKHAMDVLNRGENLPHSGRFMLATFMLNRDMPVDDVMALFSSAPDYNEKVTKYQVRQLVGQFGSGQKYMCPSCDKLRSQGLCHIKPECKRIVNPLQFGT